MKHTIDILEEFTFLCIVIKKNVSTNVRRMNYCRLSVLLKNIFRNTVKNVLNIFFNAQFSNMIF